MSDFEKATIIAATLSRSGCVWLHPDEILEKVKSHDELNFYYWWCLPL